jgi:hypothetical protein
VNEPTSPYRQKDEPLARYPLRTAWGVLLVRASLALVALAIAAAFLFLQLAGLFIGMVGWVVCLGAATVGVALTVGLARFKVPNDAEVRVYRTHLVVPSAFGGSRTFATRDLEVEARTTTKWRQVDVDGRSVSAPMSVPIEITLGSGTGRRVLSARLFGKPADAARLANDARCLREGRELADHDHPDPEVIMRQFENLFGDFFRQQAAPKRDEEDDRLDEELRKHEP